MIRIDVNNDSESIKPALKDAELIYYPHFFSENKADQYFKYLLNNVPWQQDDIRVYGKTFKQPRLTSFYASNTKVYSYSNISMYPKKFSGKLLEIKKKVEKVSNLEFTSCLLNLYRDGKDSNGWHSDDEPELGKNPVIASVSFGEERFFHLKHKFEKNLRYKILLQHGSLLIMKGKTQHTWLHQIPKTSKEIRPRINLTFRIIN
ncbi:alpha-ketoglutarate-dependent dioxygenase AlkB family protein [Abyssalbus ytuae]|uniref:Alpha-ketoglutarate-dependent dioxygenase AlkB n=1 Tax=Abyssalbus ytuae TaxID=2926907 RepID=A0A9E7CTW0_9FLAO|nr:alpha-ketoglutarate-dependent dioxygenase AlkB [Abyssalbus ytuae]UOB16932.1 alpha-ketoglutarate-dependent dioxygenase AlkB [Abyssalbus ytuae]